MLDWAHCCWCVSCPSLQKPFILLVHCSQQLTLFSSLCSTHVLCSSHCMKTNCLYCASTMWKGAVMFLTHAPCSWKCLSALPVHTYKGGCFGISGLLRSRYSKEECFIFTMFLQSQSLFTEWVSVLKIRMWLHACMQAYMYVCWVYMSV